MISSNELKQLKLLYHTYCYHHLQDRECPDNFSCGGLNVWGLTEDGPRYYSNWMTYIILSKYRGGKKQYGVMWAGKIHRAIKKLKETKGNDGN